MIATRPRKGRVALLASLLATSILFTRSACADTLEDALTAAMRSNPNLEDARLAVQAANEDRVQARAGFLPQAQAQGSYGERHSTIEQPGIFGGTTTTDRAHHPLSESFVVSQDLYAGGQHSAQYRQADAGVAGARQGLRAREQDVLLAAIQAYVSVRRDQEILRLQTDYMNALVRQLAGTRRRLEVGEVSRTDVLQVQSRLAAARASVANARATLDASNAQYEEITGMPPENLEAPPAAPVAPATLNEALAQADQTQPDLLQAREQANAARAHVGVERAALRPHISLQARADRTEDSDFFTRQDSAQATAQVTIPLYEGGFASSRTRQSEINVERAMSSVEARRRSVESDVRTAWSRLQSAGDVVSAANEQAQAAQAALEGVERERGLGLRSTLDVLDAQLEVQQAQIALARAEADSYVAVHSLMSSMGTLSYETLTGHRSGL